MPKVSVVIPLYNKEEYVFRAINSILEQTVQDFEIIVVDDGSTDNGVNAVKDINDLRIRLIQQQNAGASVARNRGINESKSELVAFLDADDAYKSEFLEIVLRLREKYPHAGAYAVAYEIREIGGKIVKPVFKAIELSPWEGIIPNYFESILGDPPVCSSAVAIPKDIFKICGSFPIGEKLGEDLDMWLRISLRYPIAFSNKVGATYFRDAQRRICSTEVSIEEQPFIKTARFACNSFKLSDRDKSFLREYMNKFNINAAIGCICSGHVEIGREKLRNCETKLFQQEKLKWLRLSKLPYFILKLLLFVKVRLVNNFLRKIYAS